VAIWEDEAVLPQSALTSLEDRPHSLHDVGNPRDAVSPHVLQIYSEAEHGLNAFTKSS
jgi:hypothetical protein